MRTAYYLCAFVVVASIYGTSGEDCIERSLFDGTNTVQIRYKYCDHGCCGNEDNRYCCPYVSAYLSGGVIAAIVVLCLILVVTVAGVILCCVCCTKAAPGTTNWGTVIMTPDPQIAVVTQGKTLNVYTQPPYTAYNVSQPHYATQLKY